MTSNVYFRREKMHSIKKLLLYISILLTFFFVSPSSGQIIKGDFSDGLNGWYTDGDVNVENGVAVIRTGGADGLWETLLSTDFTVTGDRLNFRYYFDVVGPDDINYPDYESYPFDSFQVTLNAGDPYYYFEPLAWNPTGDFLPYSMDISSIPQGTRATLTFSLLDQDDGFRSIAGIDDISDPGNPVTNPVPEPGTLILIGGGLISLFLYGRFSKKEKEMVMVKVMNVQKICLWIFIIIMSQIYGVEAVHAELIEENIDDVTTLQFVSPLFNSRTNILTLNMTVTNVSDISIFTPLKVVITGISTIDVTVANPDGYTPEGLPFFDLTPYITDRELSPGEVTPSVKLSFYNPKRVKFRWDQDVFAHVDVATGVGPIIYNICLRPGEAPPKCEFYYDDPEIENPDFDRILEGPLSEMYLYEQVRVFAYDNEGLPLQVIINGIEAEFYEWGFYYYRDLILRDGLNTISIVVSSEAGVSVTREITLNIDSIPPAINLLEPAGGGVVITPEQALIGTVDDSGVTTVIVVKDFIYADEVPVVDGVFSKNIILSPGHNNISIEATDIAGNSSYFNLDLIYVYSELGIVEGRISSSVLSLPLAGATVTAISYNNEFRTAVSGDDGSYRLEGVRSGDVTLLIEKEGYTARNLKILSLGGDTPYLKNVALIPVSSPDTFTLTGQVKDTGDHPLRGAYVSIAGAALALSEAKTPLSSLSDKNGIYIISGIPRTSFVAEASIDMYEGTSLNVNAGDYSSNTTILTYNFILKKIPVYIRIISPADGEYLSGDDVMVVGLVRNEDRNVGIRVNGVLAQVYNGYFMANDVPLAAGVNNITAELIDPSGTLLADSINVIIDEGPGEGSGPGARIHAQEAGIVPVDVPVNIEVPPDTSFYDYGIEVNGPGATELISEGPLQHRVIITVPGVYTITFNGVDYAGDRYKDTYGFIGMAREDMEEMLKSIWTGMRDYLKAGSMDDAIALITPETRGRYAEQFFLLGDYLPEIFANIGDIQLVTLKDNVAKMRIYEGEIIHYVWFARDIYGLWKIHKF